MLLDLMEHYYLAVSVFFYIFAHMQSALANADDECMQPER